MKRKLFHGEYCLQVILCDMVIVDSPCFVGRIADDFTVAALRNGKYYIDVLSLLSYFIHRSLGSKVVAVASRSIESAQSFADQHGIAKAHGSCMYLKY